MELSEKTCHKANSITWLHIEGIPTSVRYPVQRRKQSELPEILTLRAIPVLENKQDDGRLRKTR